MLTLQQAEGIRHSQRSLLEHQELRGWHEAVEPEERQPGHQRWPNRGGCHRQS